MRTTLMLTILSLSIFGCKHGQPQFPNIKTCRYIKGEVLEQDFLYCKLVNGGDWVQEIKIVDIPKVPTTEKDVVICTTMNNYTAVMQFKRETENWIEKNCN
jgi:hypothetical protein